MTDLFYNTTNETGESLKQCRRACNKQEEEVLNMFKFLCENEDYELPPSEIHELLPQYPITSIRRAITNLTKAGYLRKTAVKIVGPYGRKEHCWQLGDDKC